MRSDRSVESCVSHVDPEHKPQRKERGSASDEHTQGIDYAGIQSGNKSIEQHPLFRLGEHLQDPNRYPYGRAHGETCASCTFTVPQKVASQLPEGAPGSLPKDGGRSKHGAPVLRSKEFVCLGKRKQGQSHTQPGSSQESQTSTCDSMNSLTSHTDCHDHTLTYLTAKSPDDPGDYAQLRASVIRTLSCEILPRGMSEGPFCFGDSATGYTIAYVFRITDPKARGRRRAYSFVALAGKDAYRAFKACPTVWEAFAMMARAIEHAAQRSQDDQELQQQREKEERLGQRSSYSEPSSFLTQRPRDPDGQPRRANQTQPRSLADIIGNENIFTILHHYFVAILRCLGDKFGGLPLSPYSFQTSADEKGLSDERIPSRVSTDILANLQIIDDETDGQEQSKKPATSSVSSSTPTDRLTVVPPDFISTASTTPTQLQRSPQCGPIPSSVVDTARQGRIKA